MIEILYEDEGLVFCVKPSGVDSEGEMVSLLKEQKRAQTLQKERGAKYGS